MSDAKDWFGESDQPALNDFWLVYDKHFHHIAGETLLLAAAHPEFEGLVRALASNPPGNGNGHAQLQQTIREGRWQELEARLREEGAKYAELGISFSSWYELTKSFCGKIVPLLVKEYSADPPRLACALVAMHTYVDRSLQAIGEAYIDAKTRALAENDRRHQLLFDRSPLPMWVFDVGTLAFLAANDAAVSHYGYARADFLRMTLTDICPAEDAADLRAEFAKSSANASRTWRHVCKDGRVLQVEIWSSHFTLADREARLIVVLDVTERKQIEEQFRQAQKMDAIGKLAGGIAHDFNNLLSVILSYSHLGLRTMPPDDPFRPDLVEIEKAGERASALTRQLLAFSRQQMLQPCVLDINRIVSELEKMLRRLIGEDLQLITQPGAKLGLVRADPGQIEQVLLNLVINARDAMPSGGDIVIATADVELDETYVGTHAGASVGAHVKLSVSDAGTGMDKATQARIFEPFFTTKDPGRGTGLGLATVFSIVKQSGGSIEFHSEVGRGTSFEIYLPRSSGVETVALPVGEVASGGNETILLVEDEEPVRHLARDLLGRAGYRVLVAKNASEAKRASDQTGERIHLLLTDVVMPEISGHELAQLLAPARPGMKVLYMSGYTANPFAQYGAIESGVALLQKPLRPDSLLRHVRSVLDECE
jgi:PAS domain S-box-containing protein